jgi:uncharacterized protein (DUF488 family)
MADSLTPHVSQAPLVLYTIGHSTHSLEAFIGLLAQHRITLLTDVRSFPSSRRWPHFNQGPLQASLECSEIRYRWLKALGGRRNSNRTDSPHRAWRISAFRSYADYADTEDFAAGFAELIDLATPQRTAIMCSEGLWWQCHRRIISDHLSVRGWEVRHIMPDGKLVAHTLPEFASICRSRIVYDGGQHPLKLE